MKLDKTKSYQNASLCRKKSYNKRYTNSRTFIEKQNSDSSASLQDVWTNTLCLIDHQRVAVNKNFWLPSGTNSWNFHCLLTSSEDEVIWKKAKVWEKSQTIFLEDNDCKDIMRKRDMILILNYVWQLKVIVLLFAWSLLKFIIFRLFKQTCLVFHFIDLAWFFFL